MFSDDTMYRVLGASENITPAECYDFWYSRIGDGYYQYVNESVQNMIDTDKIIQLEYTWKHPEKGEVVVRCTGKRVEDDDGAVCLKGYHRIISDIERPKFLPDVHLKDVFEYHETENTVFFHTDRTLIFGEETHESDFPGCWVEKEIIHPHFICKFQKTFSKVRVKNGVEILELLLKSKSGMYEWFKLTMRHLGGEKQDLDTVLAVLEPIGAERMMELEYTRMSRFYKALLSEAMAYAEVDLESGQLKTIGGIWKSYEQNYLLNSDHFIEVLKSKLSPYLSEQELAEIEAHKSGEGWNTMFDRGEQTHRYSYRRSFGEESRWVELVIHIFREEITQNVYALIYLKDINNEKERELAQSEAAKRDPLTNIYNRTAFEREVTRYVKLSAYEYCGALMVLDIDNFKQINDNRGHLEGDKILRKVSQILVSTFRDEDVVGRLGGDEFLVFVKGAIKKESIEKRMRFLLKKFQLDKEASVTGSIGITLVNKSNFEYNSYLKQADTALYVSKQKGKNSFCFYEDLV